jgi:hypothetical protein
MADLTDGATPTSGGLNFEALAFDPDAGSAGQQLKPYVNTPTLLWFCVRMCHVHVNAEPSRVSAESNVPGVL